MHELALFYVGKFATTRAKLATYLNRKLRERGWDGDAAPDVDALYAQSKARSLTERGYGMARVRQSLRAAGINETDGAQAQKLAADGAADAALRFARRRRLGPYAEKLLERPDREKALAAMVRAGHGFELARAVVNAEPGSELDLDELREKSR